MAPVAPHQPWASWPEGEAPGRPPRLPRLPRLDLSPGLVGLASASDAWTDAWMADGSELGEAAHQGPVSLSDASPGQIWSGYRSSATLSALMEPMHLFCKPWAFGAWTWPWQQCGFVRR